MKYISWICLLICSVGCTNDNELNDVTNSKEGIPVSLQLSYNALLPDEIISRATDAEEKILNELHIFVFSADDNGKLKGYKKLNESELVQDGSKGKFTILTTTGTSYIYGVANTSASYYKAESFIDDNFTEKNAQKGIVDFTREEFLQKSYTMGSDNDKAYENIYMYSPIFTMSGSMNDGESFDITVNPDGKTGSVSIDDPTIILKRVVSKVNFTFNIPDPNSNNVKFTLTKYDIYNVPTTIPLMENGSLPNEIKANYIDIKGIVPTTQNKNLIKDIYLPENLKTTNSLVDTWKMREENHYTSDGKTFTNAPVNSTYIVAYGEYSDGSGKVANVEYTIHLGDFSPSTIANNAVKFSNFENQRNCSYTYNIVVHGVHDIIAEATRNEIGNANQWNPATEGLVLDPGNGKIYTLDSHYESCVMQFSRSQISTLKQANTGYVFQVETFGKKSEIVTVTDKCKVGLNGTVLSDEQLNDIDHSWITFAKGGTYNPDKTKGGAPITYTSTNPKSGEATTDISDLYTVPELLKYLYSIADDETKWDTNGTLTFTCFVKENYYEDKLWSEYTNIAPRVLFIANSVNISSDNKSIYAKVAYGVKQRAIQTIYNKDKANSIIAFGCETVDETYTGSNYAINNTGTVGSFDGRTDMINALYYSSNSWGRWSKQNEIQYKWDDNTNYAVKACMSRNRDLNRDGKITRDEVRWYIPSYEQMAGLWIGEEGINDNSARLYTGKTSDLDGDYDTKDYMHYFANTSGRYTFWAEEGSSFGTSYSSNVKYIKCIRNLQSEATGVEPEETLLTSIDDVVESTPYYSFNQEKQEFDLTNLNNQALRTGDLLDGELSYHHEREPANKPRDKFKVATNNLAIENVEIILKNIVNENPTVYCNGIYTENAIKQYWRVPNQRELCLMAIKIGLTFPNNYNTEGGYFARTRFSNSDYRYGYGYGPQTAGGDNYQFRMYMNNLNQKSGFVRCVRDVQ